MLSSASEWLNEQEWFQQLRAKWDELDVQSRLYVKLAGAAAVVLGASYFLLSSAWSVSSLKSEYNEKSELLSTMQNAYEEVRNLRAANASMGGGGGGEAESPWPAYFESQAGQAGLDKANLAIGGEKAGEASEVAKEILFEIGLKKVNIRQVVRMAFQLESGPRPVKLRNLVIDTKADPSGYMDATLNVSAFSVSAAATKQ